MTEARFRGVCEYCGAETEAQSSDGQSMLVAECRCCKHGVALRRRKQVKSLPAPPRLHPRQT